MPAAMEQTKQDLIRRQKAGEIPADLVTSFLGQGWNIRPPFPVRFGYEKTPTRYEEPEPEPEWVKDNGSYWIDPEGNHHDLGQWGEHEKWLRKRGIDLDEAMAAGWQTAVAEPRQGTVSATGHKPLTTAQKDALWKIAARHRAWNAIHEMKAEKGWKRTPVKFDRLG